MTATVENKPGNARLARQLAQVIEANSKPYSPHFQLIKGGKGTQVFVPNGSRRYDIPEDTALHLEALLRSGNEAAILAAMARFGFDAPAFITDEPLISPKVFALSLAIAQKCNMGCTYCYAGQGDFGGNAKNMPLETALKAIDLLMNERENGEKVQLTFLGGEPLMNREAIREATAYAARKAEKQGVHIGFSITTNGTLLTPEDAYFFEAYRFAVTVSLDGLKDEHDQQRPMKGGQGSYDKIMERIQPLLAVQRNMQVSARVTVTPHNTNLPETLDEFIGMGFHSVGFSPLLRSNDNSSEMDHTTLAVMLESMIACGLQFEQNVLAGRRYPFLNMINALKEIDKNTHRPYPCGAGAGYMGVSADGELAACHRFVNEPRGNMGHIDTGVDPDLQNTWLATRHVHTQEPCTSCWARYLCGGGCHHEVIEKGRPACDYIRGWLYYTMQAHERLSRLRPDWFH